MLDKHQKQLDANLKGRMIRTHVPDSVIDVADTLRKTNAHYIVHRHVVHPDRDINGDPAQNYAKDIPVIVFPSPMLLSPDPDHSLVLSSPLTMFFVLKPMWLAHGVNVSMYIVCLYDMAFCHALFFFFCYFMLCSPILYLCIALLSVLPNLCVGCRSEVLWLLIHSQQTPAAAFVYGWRVSIL